MYVAKHALPAIACLFLLCHSAFAQSPQSIPYQGIARDTFGTPIPNQVMRARLSIREGSSGGTVVYQETDSFATGKLGLFTIPVGMGTPVSGHFDSINWGSNTKFLQVEIDPTGGTSYVNLGANQMLSVPFALYSQGSGDVVSSSIPVGRIPYGNGTGLTSSADFTRSPLGNVKFQALRDGHYFRLNLGDSNLLDLMVDTVNIAAASLSYGDVDRECVSHIGVGSLPTYGQSQFAFFNMASNTNDQASINLIRDEGRPVIHQTVSNGIFGPGHCSTLLMRQQETAFYWADAGDQHVHGIFFDSTSLRLFSSTTDYSWGWPNTEGSSGQALVTNGSGELGWADINTGTAAYTAKTSAYTLSNTDYTVNCTSGTFALTLPTAVGITGKLFVLNNSGAGTITINTTASQSIDGNASGTLTLGQNKNYTLQSDGANWIILSAK